MNSESANQSLLSSFPVLIYLPNSATARAEAAGRVEVTIGDPS